MDQGTDAIRRSIDERRASIDTRLELLEAKARRLHPRNYLGWLALGSVVAAGSVAVGGIVRSSRRRPKPLLDDEVVKEILSADHTLATDEAVSGDDTLTTDEAMGDLDDDEYEIVFEDSRGHGTAALLASAAAGAVASWMLLRAMTRSDTAASEAAVTSGPPRPA
jgi:hypothetical protein